MSDRELMQQALEALEFEADFPRIGSCEPSRDEVQRTWDAIHALRARLAEPETPAPTLFRANLLRLCPALTHEQIDELAAMASPAARKVQPLTDERAAELLSFVQGVHFACDGLELRNFSQYNRNRIRLVQLGWNAANGITGDSHD